MEFSLQCVGAQDWKAEAFIVLACKNDPAKNFALEQLNELKEAAPWMEITPALRDFNGKVEELAVAYGHPEQNIPRLICAGLGEQDKLGLSPSPFDTLRRAVAIALKRARDLKCATLGLSQENLELIAAAHSASLEKIIEEVALAAKLGLYKTDAYASKKEEPDFVPRNFNIFLKSKFIPDALRAAVRRGEAAADGVIFSRDLANGPANIVTPGYLAGQAEKMASKYNFRVEVLDKEAVEKLGMGSFLAVARGSEEKLRFIIIEHCPKGAEQQTPLVYVGKGITFDSGGISLKPSAKMHEMKADMGGAAAIMGYFKTLGELCQSGTNDPATRRRVIGVMPCAENMPDGKAVKPGDVVTAFNGKTIEIINTDAEGRLILCDALAYAQHQWNPEIMVDLATLTGACAIALGEEVAGLFSSDQKLSDELRAYGDSTGDLLWPMPLWDRYFEAMKSDVADMANAGSREGGAINAALFLKQFVELGNKSKPLIWAHIDMAGPAYVAKKTSVLPGGASGFGVRLLLSLASNR